MKIRKALEGDASLIQSLYEKIFQLKWELEQAKKTVQREDVIFLLAFDESEHCLGYVELWLSFENADLCHIAVDSPYRRKGVAEILLEHGIAECVKRDVTQVTLEVRKSNEAAKGLYEKMGFQQIFIRKQYYSNPAEDALIYQKKVG